MKKPEPENQPNAPEQLDPVEQRVKDMMEVDSTLRSPAEAPDSSTPTAATAPELPHAQADEQPPATTSSTQAAIEKANEQLQAANTERLAAQETNTDGDDAASKANGQPVQQEAETQAVIESPETDKAVDEIVAHESDEVLRAEDEKRAAFPQGKSAKRSPIRRVGRFLFGWMSSKRGRRLALTIILVVITALAVVPASRYAILNTAGVRSSASVIVFDQSTQQPLRNVRIAVAGESGQTDQNGYARLENLKLGPTQLIIERRAFTTLTQNITVGWGSNPFGEFQLRPNGAQYTFRVTDYVSDRPVAKIEALYSDLSAFSDKEGLIKLTLGQLEEATVEVRLRGEGYREERRRLVIDKAEEQAVEMVPDREHAFISKRSGTFDVYKIDVDGKNEELVLAGSGSERDDVVLAHHPGKEYVAMVSTRSGNRSANGQLLSSLTVVNLNTKESMEVAKSEKIQIVDWIEDHLVYLMVAADEDAESPARHRLMSYQLNQVNDRELARANYFNDVANVGSWIYYAPSSVNAQGVNVSLFAVNADGSDKRVLLDQEVWSILRPAHDRLILALQQQAWYEYEPGSNNDPIKLSGEPQDLRSRLYVEAQGGRHSLWVDRRDGKGVLIAYDVINKQDKVLASMSGLKYPVRWLNERTAVFRVSTSEETADYVISLDGDKPKKIQDVTDTGGIDSWYYF